MKIALTADPEIPVPPEFYGGIERIIDLLATGLVEAGHEVTLFAHKNSAAMGKLAAWPGRSSSSAVDTLANSALLSAKILNGGFDVLHSFSRLAYMLPIMPLSLPKIMSYQREPTISQVKKARRLSRGSLHFTGCSRYISGQIAPVAPVSTIYNGIAFATYRAGICPPDAPLVFLGRIEKIKGAHLAIDIARRSGQTLLLAGNIPAGAETYFEQEIRPFLDDEQIRYIGPVNDQQKNAVLGSAAALLMPVLWNEPFGIVMVEAMACGTPVLALTGGAIPEVIDPGVTGFYAETVEELLGLLPAIRALDRAGVRKHAATRFDAPVVVDAYIQLYKSLIRSCT